jgi:hypothetical protein
VNPGRRYLGFTKGVRTLGVPRAYVPWVYRQQPGGAKGLGLGDGEAEETNHFIVKPPSTT